ncbi:manganese-dependent inorganic pyrophosphatase [Candidatus Photodesmus katoptron]|uniref:manganese-dependent inorganic pyrophosphatase n=1 Tax=Candidatus Photodesmus anomalopis TaxID=28176 RepID=UPI0004D96DF4|nr:manganese-dependent inorganic pyrophosphatase [Candidatus Photodesmus katoptron]KEY90540.1 manganese-dependent inorganic pyrophosphatase [Candidatus Photodesmus katoptron]
MILVIGHKNPDSDSICSALATTALLKARGFKAKPIRQGKVNRETEYILKTAGVAQPELCTNISGKKVWLVDHTDLAQAADDIGEAEILGIVDHHRLGDVMTINPLEVWIWPVGCTCTILFNLFKIEKVQITQQLAILMMSAILSDTVAFSSPTCTLKDKDAVQELAKIASVENLDQFTKSILIAKTDIKGLSATELVEKDLKAYTHNGHYLMIGQVELASLDQVSNLIKDIEDDLEIRCKKNNSPFSAIMLTDIMTARTRLIYKGKWADNLNKYRKNGMLMMENTLSRKKQCWPWIQSELLKSV